LKKNVCYVKNLYFISTSKGKQVFTQTNILKENLVRIKYIVRIHSSLYTPHQIDCIAIKLLYQVFFLSLKKNKNNQHTKSLSTKLKTKTHQTHSNAMLASTRPMQP